MRWAKFAAVLLVIGAVVASVAAIVVLKIHSEESSSRSDILISSQLSRPFILYADTTELTIRAEMKSSRIDPSSVAMLFDPPPGFQIRDFERSQRTTRGIAIVEERYTLQCLGCFPNALSYSLGSAPVTWRYREGRVGATNAYIEPLKVSSRVSETDKFSIFFRPTTLDPLPTTLHWILVWGARAFAATLSAITLAVFLLVASKIAFAKRVDMNPWSAFHEELLVYSRRAQSAYDVDELRGIAAEARLFCKERGGEFLAETQAQEVMRAMNDCAFANPEHTTLDAERQKLIAALQHIETHYEENQVRQEELDNVRA